jgi:putative oxidoreductase
MDTHASARRWPVIAIPVARLIFGGFFALAAIFKFADINAVAGHIVSVGFPVPLLLAWLTAVFELALALCLLTGAFFSEASLLAAAYVLFLAVAFHGPGRWESDRAEFRFFLLHVTLIAGLLCAALHGPGATLTIRRSLLGRRQVRAGRSHHTFRVNLNSAAVRLGRADRGRT